MIAILAVSLAAVMAFAGSASAASCPTRAKQKSSTTYSFDATCYITLSEWKKRGGSASKPPKLIGWQFSSPQMKPPYKNKKKMMSLINTFDGRNCDPRTCKGLTPGDAGGKYRGLKNPPIDTGGSPAIKPVCPPGYIITYIPKPGGGTTVTKYTCVCALWTIDDIDNPLFPPDLAAIIEAGGYIPPTQYCIMVPVPKATSSAGPRAAAMQLLQPIVRGGPPPASAAAKKPTVYRFRQVASTIKLAKKGDRIKCGYTPLIALSNVMVKDPKGLNPAGIVAGRAMGAICRLRITKVRVPRLTPSQRRLVRKGYTAIAFKVTGLPSKGTSEKERAMPYAAVKFFSRKAAAANGNRYRLVQANSKGIAVWIGKIKKTGTYTVRAAWPFYQYACTNVRLKRTPPKPRPFTG